MGESAFTYQVRSLAPVCVAAITRIGAPLTNAPNVLNVPTPVAAVQAFQKAFGVTYTPVATGSPSSTLTQVMSGQIDVGWTSPPFALDLLRDGKIRQIIRRLGYRKSLARARAS
jgi:hypothetical protein